jgi:hypothetical protein
VGETDFSFSSGSLLTRSLSPAAKKFLAPTVHAATVSADDFSAAVAPGLYVAGGAAKAIAVPAAVASPSGHDGAGLLAAVLRGGTEHKSIFGHPLLDPTTGLLIGDLR